MSKYGDFSGPYFPVFSPNTRNYGPEKTSYLDIFRAVYTYFSKLRSAFFAHIEWEDCEHHLQDLCSWISPFKDFKELNNFLIPNYTPRQYFLESFIYLEMVDF